MEIARPSFGSTASFEMPSTLSTTLSPNGLHLLPVPLQSLVSYGVQSETVRQLTEMKGYLWRHVSTVTSDLVARVIAVVAVGV